MIVEATVGTAASILVAAASYELFEKRFLRSRTDSRRRRVRPVR